MELKFQLIYTYNQQEQEIIECDVPMTFLKTKEKLAEYLTRRLTVAERDDLVKISCCVWADKDSLPEWYLDCNGKLFFN